MNKQIPVDAILALVVGVWIGWIMLGVPLAQPETGAWAQKIFYFHIPAANVGFVGFLLVAGVSLGVLLGDSAYWDCRLRPCVEASFVLASFVLITGPFWARPVWGVWWRWEPRMTTFFVLWLMYGGWFLFRNALPPGRRRRIYSAIYALLAFLNVPVVMLSIHFWKPEQQLHPRGVRLEPTMQYTLYGSFLVVFLLLLRLIWLRFDLERLKRESEAFQP